MVPVAIMAPCPSISRGTEPTVPTVPGLVSEMVVPSKSWTVNLLLRARADLVERFHIPREIQLSGCFNVRHLERTGTVFARHVHRDTDVDLVVRHPEPLAVDLRLGMIESWIALNGFDEIGRAHV